MGDLSGRSFTNTQSRTNAHRMLHKVQSRPFQVPQLAATVRLKPFQKGRKAHMHSCKTTFSLAIPENHEFIFDFR